MKAPTRIQEQYLESFKNYSFQYLREYRQQQRQKNSKKHLHRIRSISGSRSNKDKVSILVKAIDTDGKDKIKNNNRPFNKAIPIPLTDCLKS